MERVVYKFPLERNDEIQVVAVPRGTFIVHTGMQYGIPTLWMEVMNPKRTQKLKHRKFRIFGTGHTIPDDFIHVGTCVDDLFVWHVFEYLPKGE